MLLLLGENEINNHVIFAQTLQQYFAGDQRIKETLDKNRESMNWFHVMARDSLAAFRTAASRPQSDQAIASSEVTSSTANGTDADNDISVSGE